MNAAIGIYVIADNLAGVVDAGGICAVDGQRIVQGCVGAGAVEESVNRAAGGVVITDDLACVVDTLRKGS